MIFKEMTDNQRRIFIDTIQLHEAFVSAFNKNLSYRGGMHWKKSKGREYLFRSRDRFGYGKSLGPRTLQTEKILAEFQHSKQREKERLSALKDRLKEQSRFCKAALIQRVPRIVSGILRLLDQQNILGRNLIVIGTNAMYAYEAFASVFLIFRQWQPKIWIFYGIFVRNLLLLLIMIWMMTACSVLFEKQIGLLNPSAGWVPIRKP